MSIERPEKQTEKRKGSPLRLSVALESVMKFATSKIEIKGREHIDEISEGKKVIIACSHISDMDMGIVAYALKDNFNLLITHQSVQTLREEPGISLGMKIAGKENFMPIDWLRFGDKKQGKFNPDNFIKLKKYLEESGKTPIIAAHNPSKRWQLEKGGYAAVMLAQLQKNTVILPVAVNIRSEEPVGMAESRLKTLKKKPEVEVAIGEPFELPLIEGINELKLFFDKRKQGIQLSDEERKKFSELHKSLRDSSDMLMERLTQSLPKEKRGIYGKDSKK